MMSTLEDSEESDLKCNCGLPAKLRVSQTPKNPFRLFYNCPRNRLSQCGFFQWFDEPEPTADGQIDEVNSICHVCIYLQESLHEIEREHENEMAEWEREKSELTTKLSTLQAELEDLKDRIKVANESRLMPPLDTLSNSDDEDGEDGMVIYNL